MSRPPVNDPLGVTDRPNLVTDPDRVKEITDEFNRKLAYIRESFLTARQVGGLKELNLSIARLRRAVNAKRHLKTIRKRLHPALELVISQHARRAAHKRCGDETAVEEVDIAAAAEKVAAKSVIRRGRGGDPVLRHHVEGLMALLIEATAKPIRAEKPTVYNPEPRFLDEVSSGIQTFFQGIDDQIATITLVDMVLDARRKFADKHMRFRDFFPLYGVQGEIFSSPLEGPTCRVESFEPNIPIFTR